MKKKILVVDDRTSAERVLEAAKEKYRSLFEELNDAVVITTRGGELVDANTYALNLFGYTKKEMQTMSFQELYVNPDDGDRFRKEMKGRGAVRRFETKLRRSNGVEMNCILNVVRRQDEKGTTLEYQGVIRDITETKRAQEEMKTSQQRLSQIINFLPDATMVIDLQGKVIAWNRAIESMTGIMAREMLGKGDYEYAIPFYGERRPVLIDLVGQWNKDMEKKYQYIKKEGESLVSETYDSLVKPGGYLWNKASLLYDNNGQIIGAIESIRDITDRKVAEETLSRSEEKYRRIFENSVVGFFQSTPEGQFTDVNPAFARMLGYKSPEDLVSTIFDIATQYYHDPEDRRRYQQALQDSGYVDNFEFRARRKDGSLIWVSNSTHAYSDKEVQNGHYEGVVRDITGRKKAEEALRENKEKYRTLVEESFDGIFVQQGSKIVFTNTHLTDILGYAKGELLGMDHWLVYHPDYHELTRRRAEARMRGEAATAQYEVKFQRKDGSSFEGEINAKAISFQGEPGVQVWVRNIDERKQMEQERIKLESRLQHSQKMEAIATLAGGVAHEFNNALMGIMGNIELLKMDLPEDERRDRYFKAMRGSGHRMSRLTDQLLAYAQGGKYQPKDLKLDDFVIQTLPILQHDIGPEVRVETHFPKDISYIMADNAQMQMVLSAILSNSNEAIEDEGLIRITAGNKDVDEDFTKQHPGLKPGYYVCLTIEDDGKGMDEETKKGIFEPFFTTKFQGRGMGMAAVYGIVKNHDGWISVDSELGKGSVVQIYFPAISAGSKAQGAKAGEQPEVELAIGEGTILMIEDEEVVIEVTRAMLERLGYRVMVAKTGKDARHITETFDGRIDLALLDIKLPDMEGGKVYPLIMKARPDLKVIVFSGYAIEGPAQDILDAGAQGFIQKPFSLATLSEKLKEVLEGKTNGRNSQN